MGDESTPISRLLAAGSGLFEPVDPSGPPIEVPQGVKDWGWNTAMLSMFTSTFMGLSEHWKQQNEPLRVPQHLPPVLHDMFLRNQQSARVAKVANRALWSGVYALIFGTMFYGSEAACGIARNKMDDKYNTVFGGCVAGSAAGGMLPGSIPFKLSRAALGCLAGGSVGAVVGYISHDLVPALESKPAEQSSELIPPDT